MCKKNIFENFFLSYGEISLKMKLKFDGDVRVDV